ncbi:MAG: glycoside hydrolase family 97 protein [Opitutae bacterium]|nr:glycoside hydrolase family 97 protein [Opitutae bacterium]
MKHRLALSLLAACAAFSLAQATEESFTSPDGRVAVTVSDTEGLHYRVSLDGQPALVESQLGLDFKGGIALGRAAKITAATRTEHDGTWENSFGPRRVVLDRYRELKLELAENSDASRRLNLIVRAYDNGIALRYEIPAQPGLETFTITDERTEFVFPSDLKCWAGNPSGCAENQYPEKKLTELTTNAGWAHVLPLLVQMPNGYAAIAESDLLDWAGMFVSAAAPRADGAPRPGAKVSLAARHDGNGRVVGRDRRVSPWRVVLLARTAAELLTNDLVATLATPSRLADTSWVKPGVSAWDAWWTGVNPSQPKNTGVYSRGDTRSHQEFIDFAAEMGFRYQVMDWFWYDRMTLWDKGLNSPPNQPSGDFTRALPHIDVPALVAYARERGIGLWIWAHSLDIKTFGMERALDHLAKLGVVGIKVDFFNSDSQETVQWIEQLLECAARHRLMVDLHGVYKPTGLARTYPNFLTQEGVLGNEYNKLDGNQCDTRHTITLPFTRGLLGPADFTPGGFLNRTAADFKVTSPAQVIGTRARQLAETVVYFSPLLVLCDSPTNYRGQPGVEFFRGLPTVWDETVVLSAEVAEHVVIARRSGSRWYLAAMNGNAPLTLRVPLKFLGAGAWQLRAFADTPESATRPETIAETTRAIAATDTLELTLSPAGGYVAVLTRL